MIYWTWTWETLDDDTRWLLPPSDVILPPLHPCMGGNPRPVCGLRPTPHCLPVCCYWLLILMVLARFQACDLCHASFLRLLSAIASSAFSISGTGLLFVLPHRILRVHIKVFVVFVSQMWLATMQGLQGGRMTSERGSSHRVSSSCGAGLHFGVVVAFVCFICGCIFRAPFSTFGCVVFFVCCKKHVLPLACIFSTDF